MRISDLKMAAESSAVAVEPTFNTVQSELLEGSVNINK